MSQLREQLGQRLAALAPGTFVILEFTAATCDDPYPYSQCAREIDGWYLEVVSAHYLPAEVWPLDELALRRGGWAAPDDRTDNWWRVEPSPEAVAGLLVEALVAGRRCPSSPDAFRIVEGRFGSGGPDGGEPLPLPWAA